MIEPRSVCYDEWRDMVYGKSNCRDFVVLIEDNIYNVAIFSDGKLQLRICHGPNIKTAYDVRFKTGPFLEYETAASALRFITDYYPEEAVWFLFHPELF